jgi:hypothetical protein
MAEGADRPLPPSAWSMSVRRAISSAVSAFITARTSASDRMRSVPIA